MPSAACGKALHHRIAVQVDHAVLAEAFHRRAAFGIQRDQQAAAGAEHDLGLSRPANRKRRASPAGRRPALHRPSAACRFPHPAPPPGHRAWRQTSTPPTTSGVFSDAAKPRAVAARRAHVIGPGRLQARDIGGRDLGQRRIAAVAIVMAIGGPFLQRRGRAGSISPTTSAANCRSDHDPHPLIRPLWVPAARLPPEQRQNLTL